MRLSTVSLAAASLLAASGALRAQWVSYTDQTSTRTTASAALFEDDTQEKDYAWGDLDKDGDTDLICVRKSPFTSGGHFQNLLLMNEGGVLVDRSSTLTMSTVAGSSAFLDATNDRDVCICDVNGDTWPDVVTCTTLTSSMPKYIRVPRVYINQGEIGGVWQGLLYDDENRIDDAPWGGHQRFCAVAAGDVDGDGDLDLYFGDYQQGGTRPVDVNDRLLINDGSGYFSDQSSTRMTAVMLESSFGMQVDIQDMNGDGRLDIIKDDALNAPQGISISYNNSGTLGVFGDYEFAYNNTPYHFDIGDLNNDGRLDMIVSDDGQDRYAINTGNGADGLANFTEYSFSYSGGGGDDGFAGNNLIVDLDNDGWNDAVVADVDVDISGCNRRCHIFRNLAGSPVVLQEQIVAGEVVGGITTADLQGTFDVAVFDIDGDGWKDMVVGRCTGTQIYMNDPPVGLTIAFSGGIPSMIAPGETQTIDITATGIGGISPVPGSGQLYYSINGAPFQSVGMTDTGPGQYQGTLPAMPNCADGMRFYVSVQGDNGGTFSDPPAAPAGYYEAVAAVSLTTVYENNFESNGTGWTVQNDPSLTTGAWERADPVGTISNGSLIAPDDDAEAGSATFAFITQNGVPGGAAGTVDVDGGPTDLISPPIDLAGTDGFVSYQRWFVSTGSDVLEVHVSGNGSSWTLVETVGTEGPNWLANQFRVGDYITPTANVQVRFRVEDASPGSLVEAGVDVFKVEAFSCDYCQPNYPVMTVGNASMSMCGDQLTVATPNTTLSIEDMPAFTSGLLLMAVFPFPSPAFGGELINPGPTVLGPVIANASGDFTVPLSIGGLLPAGWALYLQTIYTDNSLPQDVGITNALKVEWF